MGSEFEKLHARNKLDKFFDDLFREDLKMKIDKTELNFLKRGMRYLVQTIANLVFVYGRKDIDSIMTDYKLAYPGLMFFENVEDVLKVGSIYDKTRNVYPNEFDFLLVLFAFSCESDTILGYTKFGYTYKDKFKALHHLIRNVLSLKSIAETLVYRDPQENDKEIKFDTYIGLYGCSSKLRFSYEKGDSITVINVDIALSTKRLDPELHFKKLSTLGLFDREIAKTGSVLYVNENLTFTETEVEFVKKVMSVKHRKAYRILKYLVNGHKDGDILENVIHKYGHFGERITSHMIKTEMIHHHYSCHRVERVVSPCVIEVLNCLQYYDSNNSVPSLTHTTRVPHFFRSVDKLRALEDMVDVLNDMRIDRKPYRYDKDRITPIAKSMLTYPRQPNVEITKTKPYDWLVCVGTYCINVVEIALAVFLFSIFLVALIQHM